MKRTSGPLLIAVLLAGVVGWNTRVASGETTELLDQAVVARGDEYRKVVSALLQQPDLNQTLDGIPANASLPWQKRLVAKIVLARSAHGDVFREYDEFVTSLRARLNSKTKPLGMPLEMAGILLSFAGQGPESKFIEEARGWEATHWGRRQKREKVEKYTDAEVAAGKARNAAVRLAMAEHLLKLYGAGDEYEQREVLEAVCDSGDADSTWLPVAAVTDEVCRDANRPLCVRAEALLRLPKCDDALAREMFLGVLTSGEISDLAINHRMVMQIIGYLKRHDIEALKAVKAKPRWKQAEINAALGLPAPPPSEEDLRREREELQTE